MKLLFTISFVSFYFTGISQVWVNEPISIGSKTYYLSVIRPPSYTDSSTKKYPSIMMLNGLGENTNNLGTINSQGPNDQIVNRGWSGTQIFNSKKEEFIFFSLQNNSGSRTPSIEMIRIYDTLYSRYRMDTLRQYVVGLSLGGQQFLMTTADSGNVSIDRKLNLWTAATILSSGSGITNAVLDSLRRWTIRGGSINYAIGNTDVGSNRITAPAMLAAANSGRAGSGTGYTWTAPPWPTSGHGGWYYGFDSAYIDPVMGSNLYVYLLKHTKQPYADVGQATINLSAGTTSTTLNGITTQFAFGWNGWGKEVTWAKVLGGSATIATPSRDTTLVSGLAAGTYIFSITSSNGASGINAYKYVTVNVASSGTGSKYIKKRGRKLIITSH